MRIVGHSFQCWVGDGWLSGALDRGICKGGIEVDGSSSIGVVAL